MLVVVIGQHAVLEKSIGHKVDFINFYEQYQAFSKQLLFLTRLFLIKRAEECYGSRERMPG